MSKININNNKAKPAVLCEMPAELLAVRRADGGPAFWYATKFAPMHHIDIDVGYAEEFVITGVFKDNQSGAATNLLKATQVVFDCDLVDVVKVGKDANGQPLMDIVMKEALKFYADNNITTVYKTTRDGSPVSISDVRDAYAAGNQHADITTVLKGYLGSLAQDVIIEKVNELLPQHIKFLQGVLGGKLPTHVVYSGTGYHLHYHLPDTEGWTELGLQQLNEADRAGKFCNIPAIKAAYEGVLEAFQAQFGYGFDDKLKQIGTAATRDFGTYNSKLANNKKVVTRLDPCDGDGNNLSDANARLSLSDFSIKMKVKQETKKPGRPKKPTEFKAMEISADRAGVDTVTFKGVGGAEVTVTVSELYDMVDELIDGRVFKKQTLDGKAVLKIACRLDWLSSGSLNAWVIVHEDDASKRLTFMCNVEKYNNIDPEAWKDGKVGVWSYLGGWLSRLAYDEKGKLLDTNENIQQILGNDPRFAGHIRHNVRTNTIECSGALVKSFHNCRGNRSATYDLSTYGRGEWVSMEDATMNFLKHSIETDYLGKRIAKDVFYDVVELFGREWYSLDPLQDWFVSLQWDGVTRLDTWLPEILGMNPSHKLYSLYGAYGRSTLLSIARCAFYHRGVPPRLNHMLTIYGTQNAGKSTFARVLGSAVDSLRLPYFLESELKFGNVADLYQQLNGRLVAEVPELESFDKASTSFIKSFLTKGVEVQRVAYGRKPQEFTRTCYLVGTTNTRTCLRDKTGNRRFLVVNFNESEHLKAGRGHAYNLKTLKSIMPHLYAEAYLRAVQGVNIPKHRLNEMQEYGQDVVEDWNLALSELEQQAIYNTSFEVTDENLEILRSVLDSFVAAGKVDDIEWGDIQRRFNMASTIRRSNEWLSRSMTDLGWEKYAIGRDKYRWRVIGAGQQNPTDDDPTPPPTGGGSSNSGSSDSSSSDSSSTTVKDTVSAVETNSVETNSVETNSVEDVQSSDNPVTEESDDMAIDPTHFGASVASPIFAGFKWYASEDMNGDASLIFKWILQRDPLTCSANDFIYGCKLARVVSDKGNAKSLTNKEIIDLCKARQFPGWPTDDKGVKAKVDQVVKILDAQHKIYDAKFVKGMRFPTAAFYDKQTLDNAYKSRVATQDMDYEGDDLMEAVFLAETEKLNSKPTKSVDARIARIIEGI